MNEERRKFIYEHGKENVAALKLKYGSKELPFDLDEALLQIECRRKYADKLGSFVSYNEFVFPTRLAAEQASDQRVAAYHSKLAEELLTNMQKGNTDEPFAQSSFLDMTAGLGIDAMTLANKGMRGIAVDIEKIKTDALEHNTSVLGLDNLKVICADSIEWLTASPHNFDLIFIDPARRDADNKRLYSLADCRPDVTRIIGLLTSHARLVMIKGSPLLDVTQVMRELPQTVRIDIVSVKGECKETLIICAEKSDGNSSISLSDTSSISVSNNSSLPLNSNSTISINCVDIDDEGIRKISIPYSDLSKRAPVVCSSELLLNPYRYIYQPSASIMKVNAGFYLCNRCHGLLKGAENTNLYFSEVFIADFPGRTLRINTIIDRKTRNAIKGVARNIVSRNYPLTPAEIERKYKVKGDASDRDFLIGCRVGRDNTPVLIDATLC